MISLQIPPQHLLMGNYMMGSKLDLVPELARWLAEYAPAAQVTVGIVWQFVTFTNEEEAALAKLTWSLKSMDTGREVQ